MAGNFSIIAIDAEETADHYDEVADRAVHGKPAFEKVMRLLEESHASHFASLRGRYVLTGATLASLTQPSGTGAIRVAHQDSLHFGTTVDQAHYLTKAPRDPDNDQIRKPNNKLSAVMVLSKKTKETAAQILLDYVVEPFG